MLKNKSIFYIFLTFVSIFISASYGPLSKKLVTVLHPIHLSLFVQVISICFFFFILGLLPELKKTIKESKHKRKKFIIYSFLNGFLAVLLYVWGIKNTSAINAVILSNTYSIFLIVSSVIVFKDRISVLKILGLLILLSGVLIIGFQGKLQILRFGYGDLMIVLANFVWVIGDVINKKYFTDIHPDVVVLGKKLVSVAFFFVISFFVSFSFDWSAITSDIVWYMVLISLFPLLIGNFLFNYVLKLVSASTISFINLTYPLFGVVLSWLIVGDKIFSYHYIGGMVIVFGLLITQIKPGTFHPVHHIRHLHNNHSVTRKL